MIVASALRLKVDMYDAAWHFRYGPKTDMRANLIFTCNIGQSMRLAMTSANYETGLAATDDIPAILAMQEVNLHENGGGLSVRQTADWFRRTMSEMPIVVARRDSVVVDMLSRRLLPPSHTSASFKQCCAPFQHHPIVIFMGRFASPKASAEMVSRR